MFYLRHQRADVLGQQDLRGVGHNVVGPTGFVVLLFVFYLAGRKDLSLSNSLNEITFHLLAE